MAWPFNRRRQRSVVASAAQVDLSDRKAAEKILRAAQAWQHESWTYRDEVPELRYAFRFLANAVSRMRLYPAYIVDPAAGPVHITDAARPAAEITAAKDALDRLGNHAEVLATLDENLSWVGECYLIGQVDALGAETWQVRSMDEVHIRDGVYELVGSPVNGAVPKTGEVLDPERSFVARMWNPHPRFADMADSSMRAVLPLCAELLLLGRMIRQTARSRLAGSGILLVAEELSFGAAEDDDDPQADPFMRDLTQSMLTPISNEGDAGAVVPHVVTVPADLIEKKGAMDRVTFDRLIDEHAVGLRTEVLGRIATGIDLPKEVLTGIADLNHWCVDEQTEALTPRGWVRHDRLHVGDLVRTLDHETGLASWQPVLDLYRADVVDEPMVHMQTRNHSSLTTPNHRWPTVRISEPSGRQVREFTHTRDLTVSHRITTGAVSGDTPTTAKYDDALVEAVAWFWTEGNCGASGAVTIAQSHTRNPERVARIRAALTVLYGPGRESCRQSGGPAWRESVQPNRTSFGGPVTVFHLNQGAAALLLEVAPGKRVDPAFILALTTAQLALFVDISCQGDGQHYRAGQYDIWQRDRAALDAFELALILTGRMVVASGDETAGWRATPWAQTEIRPVKAAVEAARTESGGATIREVPYTGVVWCPVTPHGTWLARRAGTVYYTGNSAWQVDDTTFRHHIEPAVVRDLSALTVGYYRSYLIAAGIDPMVAARHCIWYDPVELVTQPNRAQDAKDAYAAGSIGREPLRDALGFTDADAPTELDEVLYVVKSLRGVDPNIAAAIIKRIDAGIAADADAHAERAAGLNQPPTPALPTGSPAEPTPAAETPGSTPQDAGPPPAPVTAALTAAAGTVRQQRMSRRLLDIDRTVRVKVTAAADASLRRALERAGNRARSAANKQPALRASVSAVAAAAIPATLGPALLADLGLADEELLADSFSDLQRQFGAWTQAAQNEALDTAATLAGLNPDDPGVDTLLAGLRVQQNAHRARAWDVLFGALTALARDRLYDPSPNAPAAGEHDPSMIVPTGLVRAALAVAGGAGQAADSAGLDENGQPLDPGEAVGQIGTGAVVTDLLTSSGMAQDSYEWVYGTSSRPFEPHLALDGTQFDSFTDDALRNGGSWPEVEFYLPGDHDGCSCDYLVNWAAADASLAASGGSDG